MNCDHASKVLDAYHDQELDPGTHAQLTQHLASCGACDSLRSERDALRAGLRALPRHAAPAGLRDSIVRALSAADGVHVSLTPRHGSWWRALALSGATAVVAFMLGFWVALPNGASDEREAAVTRHAASLGSGHAMVQVSSADRHLVKPWFAGKLDFSPPVRDLAEQGFDLVGGRLDTLSGRTAAAVVYRIRRHDISLFVSPASAAQAGPIAASTLRGFAVVVWAQDGLGFVAVSDVDPRELQRFAELVRSPAR